MTTKKGQAALDFLMTYGWAIALVVIVAAALFALGVFDISNFVGTKAAGFSGVAVQAWQFTSGGTLTVKLTNQVGQRINVTAMSATIGSTTATFNGTGKNVDIGATTDALPATGFVPQTVGSGYQAIVTVNYTSLDTGFNATTKGTLTGKVI